MNKKKILDEFVDVFVLCSDILLLFLHVFFPSLDCGSAKSHRDSHIYTKVGITFSLVSFEQFPVLRQTNENAPCIHVVQEIMHANS